MPQAATLVACGISPVTMWTRSPTQKDTLSPCIWTRGSFDNVVILGIPILELARGILTFTIHRVAVIVQYSWPRPPDFESLVNLHWKWLTC